MSPWGKACHTRGLTGLWLPCIYTTEDPVGNAVWKHTVWEVLAATGCKPVVTSYHVSLAAGLGCLEDKALDVRIRKCLQHHYTV